MRILKTFLLAAALVVPLALVPTAKAQVSFGINVGGPPPVCQYGYYSYPPYACAPYGYWGPNYFYNGIFIGVGPWRGWGYNHGWGGHRFVGSWTHGGAYRGGYRGGYAHAGYRGRGYAGRGYAGGHAAYRGGGAHGGGFHGGGGHAAAAHGGGFHGGGHAGGGGHGGGGRR